MSNTGYGYCADGDINGARFVIPSASSDFRVTEATTNTEKFIGISQRGTRKPPYLSLDDGLVAKAGERLRVFHEGEVCGLELGGTVVRGDWLTATTGGKGVAASTGQYYGARALQSGASGQIIEVEVIIGQLN